MKNNTIAIIPARSGSKSIKDKNLALLAGHPLIAFSIAAARMSRLTDRVIVSTDSQQYADLAIKYGAEVPFIRPAEISTDTSTDRDFMVHAMEWTKSHEGAVPEFWVHLRPTTPLRNPQHLDEAIQLLSKDAGATALRSAHKSPESPFKWFRKNTSGYFVALTTDDTALDRFNAPRQVFPDVFIPDGYVDIVRASFTMASNQMHGNRVLCYESPFCTEVDSAEELDRLTFEIDRKGSPLLEYLDSRK